MLKIMRDSCTWQVREPVGLSAGWYRGPPANRKQSRRLLAIPGPARLAGPTKCQHRARPFLYAVFSVQRRSRESVCGFFGDGSMVSALDTGCSSGTSDSINGSS